MTKKEINTGWTMYMTGENKKYAATVPGSVYSDLLANHAMPDPYYRDNEMAALDLMKHDFIYETAFTAEDFCGKYDYVTLKFYGIDTIADIYLNDTLLDSTCNMHCEWAYMITSILKERNTLKIVLHSPTKYIGERFTADPVEGSEDAMRGFTSLRKAHCMFGWDWGPRLPDAGIWRPIELIGYNDARISDVYITQNHSAGQVELSAEVFILAGNEAVRQNLSILQNENKTYYAKITVLSPENEELYKDISYSEKIVIKSPQLWWPNGYGKQPLYKIIVTLMCGNTVLDVWEKHIGLRTMTVAREKDEFGESFAHEINGIRIFAMGADYIPEDNILSRINKKRTRKLLEQCVMANFNCIRVWGGGYYPNDDFYDICDELGLIVWQDFMFACANYRLTEEFEEQITRELRQNIRRLRHHASLGLWCGNNEMEKFAAVGEWGCDDALRADYIKMYEYIFPKILKEEDPQTFYWPASPSSGGGFDNPDDETRGDVHYWDVWHGNKPFTEYRKFYFRYLSEFGFQSFPSIKTVEAFTLPSDRNVFSYVMEKHQRNASANGKLMNYMQQMYLYPTDFDTFIYASQLLQAEAIRYGVEHFRRHRGRCMGTVYWQLNDCWPVASWSSIDYYGRWKALHYFAKRFFAPLMISCEEEGLLTQSMNVNAEPFDVEKSIRLNVANETLDTHFVTVNWQLRTAGGGIKKQASENLSIEPLCSKWLDKVYFSDADLYSDYVSYALVENGILISEGTVLFCQPKHFHFENPDLSFSVEGDEIVITSCCYAKSVEIRNENDDLICDNNFFDLNKETKRIKVISGDTNTISLRSVYNIR